MGLLNQDLKMSISLYQDRNSYNIFGCKIEQHKDMDNIKIYWNVSLGMADKLIQKILVEFCDISVLGYNKLTNKYLGKKYCGSICVLLVEVKINEISDDLVEIKVVPLVGNIRNIKAFITDLQDSISTYKSSGFIRETLDVL